MTSHEGDHISRVPKWNTLLPPCSSLFSMLSCLWTPVSAECFGEHRGGERPKCPKVEVEGRNAGAAENGQGVKQSHLCCDGPSLNTCLRCTSENGTKVFLWPNQLDTQGRCLILYVSWWKWDIWSHYKPCLYRPPMCGAQSTVWEPQLESKLWDLGQNSGAIWVNQIFDTDVSRIRMSPPVFYNYFLFG